MSLQNNSLTPAIDSKRFFTLLFYLTLLFAPVGLSGIGLIDKSTAIGNISVADFLLIVLLAVLAIMIISGYRIRITSVLSKYLCVASVFLLIPIVSMWNVIRYNTSMFASLFPVVKLTVCLLYGLVTVIFLSNCSREGWRRFVIVAALSCVAFSTACIIGAGLFYLGHNTVFVDAYEFTFRASGFQEDPNLAAIFQVMSLSYCFLWLRFTRRRKTVLCCLVIVLLGALTTNSKAITVTLIAVTLISLLILFLSKHLRAAIFFSFALFGVGMVVLILYTQTSLLKPLTDRLAELISGDSSVALTGRNYMWEAAIELLSMSPVNLLFGVGIGLFPTVARLTRLVPPEYYGFVAHNTFISFFVECGILQVLLLAGIMVGYTVTLLIRTWKEKNLVPSAMLWGMIAIFIFMNALNFQNNRMAYIFLAFVAATLYRMDRDPKFTDAEDELPVPADTEKDGE